MRTRPLALLLTLIIAAVPASAQDGSTFTLSDSPLDEVALASKLKERIKSSVVLARLYLDGCTGLTDDHLKTLGDLGKLEWLDLHRCPKLTDAGLAHLAKLTGLKRLCLGPHNKITAEGVKKLGESLKGCKIIHKTLPPLETALDGVRAQRRWKETFKDRAAFMKDVGPRFEGWSKMLVEMSTKKQHHEADRLCDAIVRLRDHWGDRIWPLSKTNSFGRDRFVVGALRVDAVQFFGGVDFYPGDDRMKKFYLFTVYKGKEVHSRYYLEFSNLIRPYYVLGLFAGNKHTQVLPFGARRPSFWALKSAVIKSLRN